jgi:hypothetical protein
MNTWSIPDDIPIRGTGQPTGSGATYDQEKYIQDCFKMNTLDAMKTPRLPGETIPDYAHRLNQMELAKLRVSLNQQREQNEKIQGNLEDPDEIKEENQRSPPPKPAKTIPSTPYSSLIPPVTDQPATPKESHSRECPGSSKIPVDQDPISPVPSNVSALKKEQRREYEAYLKRVHGFRDHQQHAEPAPPKALKDLNLSLDYKPSPSTRPEDFVGQRDQLVHIWLNKHRGVKIRTWEKKRFKRAVKEAISDLTKEATWLQQQGHEMQLRLDEANSLLVQRLQEEQHLLAENQKLRSEYMNLQRLVTIPEPGLRNQQPTVDSTSLGPLPTDVSPAPASARPRLPRSGPCPAHPENGQPSSSALANETPSQAQNDQPAGLPEDNQPEGATSKPTPPANNTPATNGKKKSSKAAWLGKAARKVGRLFERE